MAGASAYQPAVPHGLMFHRFRANGAPRSWQGAITPVELDQILRFVGIDRILSPDQWMSRLAEDRLEDGDVCVTFDDGLRSQVDHALPVLERYGLTAFWFVYSCIFDRRWVKSEIYSFVAAEIGGMHVVLDEFLDRCPASLHALLATDAFRQYSTRQGALSPFYSHADLQYRFLRNNLDSAAEVEDVMDAIVADRGFSADAVAASLWLGPADVAALTESGHRVGLHSYDHPYWFDALGIDQQRMQYQRNFDDIVRVTGRLPDAMAHPLGYYNRDSLAALSELGIRCGFRAFMSPVPGRGVAPSPLELPRQDATTLLAMLPQMIG